MERHKLNTLDCVISQIRAIKRLWWIFEKYFTAQIVMKVFFKKDTHIRKSIFSMKWSIHIVVNFKMHYKEIFSPKLQKGRNRDDLLEYIRFLCTNAISESSQWDSNTQSQYNLSLSVENLMAHMDPAKAESTQHIYPVWSEPFLSGWSSCGH